MVSLLLLHSGPNAEAHRTIVDFLEQRRYRVAHVTVDYQDNRYTYRAAMW
jgi:hypothetical protein